MPNMSMIYYFYGRAASHYKKKYQFMLQLDFGLKAICNSFGTSHRQKNTCDEIRVL